MKPAPLERSIQSEIRTLLELNGFVTHHLEVFAAAAVDYKGRTRRFTEGTPGQADLIAVRPFSGGVVGLTQTLYIEVKRKGSRSKKHQECWQAVRRREGFAVLADCRSWSDVVTQARSLGIEVERAR